MASLILVCVVLAFLQVAAALPWLMGIDIELRLRVRQVLKNPLLHAGWIGTGIAAGFFLETNSDPTTLMQWGRLYGSVLHLQLGADFFVGIFWLMSLTWPKGGAVALSAFREGLRQPMYWLLVIIAAAALGATPFIPYFTFGEDLKMVKEIGYAITMLLPGVFAVLAASLSISEEIEGRTAVTLMSKPVSRRQFLLGKFGGILLAALFMTVLLGWALVWIIIFKQYFDPPIVQQETPPDPAWVTAMSRGLLGPGSAAELVRGLGMWGNEALAVLPGLTIGFCQVMVLTAIAVTLATRLPMIVNLTAWRLVYGLGHLTPIMTEVSRNRYALVYFVAQLFETLLPGLDLFDVGTAVVREMPLDTAAYALYALNVSLYACIYTSIALLFGLILFEDRDLA